MAIVPKNKIPLRLLFGGLLLIVQLGMIVFARFTEARYFCWAPHDVQNEFILEVTLDGQKLSAEDIFKRYRIPKKSTDPRSIQHVKDALKKYELIYSKDNPAKIVMNYNRNGVEQESWRWPPIP